MFFVAFLSPINEREKVRNGTHVVKFMNADRDATTIKIVSELNCAPNNKSTARKPAVQECFARLLAYLPHNFEIQSRHSLKS